MTKPSETWMINHGDCFLKIRGVGRRLSAMTNKMYG
jgi:hypothetical protein